MLRDLFFDEDRDRTYARDARSCVHPSFSAAEGCWRIERRPAGAGRPDLRGLSHCPRSWEGEVVAITDERLRELIATDEGQYHDLKSLFAGPPGQKRSRDRREVRDQIAEQMAGFANAEGGIAIFGVEDDAEITGHAYPREVIERMLAVPTARLIPPQPAGVVRSLDGHELLVFEVESAARAVMVDGNGFPYRIGDSTRQFSEERINAIKDLGIVESAEARRSKVTVVALDQALVTEARDASGLAGLSTEDYLVRRRLADRGVSGLSLREAAVFLFARDIEAIEHPHAGVRVFRVAGTERLTGERHNVQEFPRIEGNLPSVVRATRTLLDTLIQKSSRLHDLFFREMPDYPTFVWTEALVNAVAHRDYGIQGRSIEVWLFDDRLEIKSPGVAPATVSMDELKQGRPTHASRNPRLVRVLVELGLMREQGEGIPRMFEEMQVSFLPMPELDADGGWFRVVLRSTPIFQSTDQRWSQAVRELPILVSQKRALVALNEREFANADYCELNRIDRDSAYRELQDLVERGLVEPVGHGAGMRYRVRRAAVVTPATEPATPIEILSKRLGDTGFITNTDYREAFGVDRYAARQALARWIEGGFLVLEGERRHAKYRATAQWPPT